jgi:glycosyltransferase involved in cell wall biosynthesis
MDDSVIPMKLAYFCNEYPPRTHGGIGTFVKSTAELMSREGHEVFVVEIGENDSSRSENGVTVVTLKRSRIPKFGWVVDRLSLWKWLVVKSRHIDLDIFEVPEYQGWLPIPLLFRPGLKVVVRLHQSATAMARISNSRIPIADYICEYLTLRFHGKWIAVSRFILEHTKKTFRVDPKSSDIIYNPVLIKPALAAEIEALPPLTGPYILFVGSLSVRKGVLAIAEAARHVLAKNDALRFVFIGGETDYIGKPISEAVKNIVGSAYADRMQFMGRFPHVRTLYWMRHAVAVALPSHIEAFALVPLEAMAMGTPTIFSSGSSGTEVIDDGVNGFLISPDDIQALAERILSLVNDPELRREMSDAALARVKKFNAEDFLKQCEATYSGLRKN